MNFVEFCDALPNTDFRSKDPSAKKQVITEGESYVFTYTNSSGAVFPVSPSVALAFLQHLVDKSAECIAAWTNTPSKKLNFTEYEEKSYRAIFLSGEDNPELTEFVTTARSQTQGATLFLAKLICYLGDFAYHGIHTNTRFDKKSVETALLNTNEKLQRFKPKLDLAIETSMRERFKNWLAFKKGHAPSSVVRYSDQTASLFNRLAASLSSGHPDFFSIETVNQFDAVYGVVSALPDWIDANLKGKEMFRTGANHYRAFLVDFANFLTLPKPFLLLAGISGTGKSRFVKQQAISQWAGDGYVKLIPVRPDWHEPSDLVGYVSRIGAPKYVPTAFLLFLVKAWKAAFLSASGSDLQLRPLNEINTFWLCLDEMNLAPVEQYFADYLSVLETRRWVEDRYTCDPLIHPRELLAGEGRKVLNALQKSLELDGCDDLWNFFLAVGIPIPPNLVVAGTVNMDETTHGFSRKVIDRALTFDFGNFFPNDFGKYFGGQNEPRTLSFARYSNASLLDLNALVPADPTGQQSTKFLSDINGVLKNTPFEVAFRALNELLVSLLCFKPKDRTELLAVWDDFLMCKVLPRLEGDEEKFGIGEKNVMNALIKILESTFPNKAKPPSARSDLLNFQADGTLPQIAFRSTQKLQWMQERLKSGFTSFWP